MTNLLNKSNHPVEVKKVKIRIWTLRSEIEAAIAIKLENTDESDLTKLDIQDIQTFYHNHVPREIEEDDFEDIDMDDSNVSELTTEEDVEESEEAEADESESDEAEKEEQTNDDTEDNKAQVESLEESDSEKEEASNSTFTRPIPKDEYIFQGELLLADLHMDQVMLFTDRKFLRGQNIIIQFMVTSPFVISGEVKHVVNFARNSKIIKEIKLDHRIQVECSLLFPDERSRLREFLTSVEPTIPPAPKRIKNISESDDDDDDFDDLGL